MTRRSLLLSVFAPLPKKPTRKFYVTGGHRPGSSLNDCDIPPIVCYGSDSLDALSRSGITVWEAADYERIDPAFRKTCEQAKERR